METRLIHAIASIFFSGIYIFGMKVISMRNYNTSLVSFYSYGSALLIAAIFYIYSWIGREWLLLVSLFAFWNISFYFVSTVLRVKCLEYIDSVIFLPIYKTFSPIFITWISLFWFQETLSWKDWLWIMAGIAVPLLLITKSENKKQNNLQKGIILIIVISVLAAISGSFSKMSTEYWQNKEAFVFFSMLVGVVLSFISYKKIQKKSTVNQTKWILPFWLWLGVFFFFSCYAFIHAVEWNFAVAYTINSFHILIPIILSVIFYKEEMTYKKALVVFLSIVSVILFI